MKPIMFVCKRLIPKSTAVFFAEVADTARWREFNGYGILAGIESASYEMRTQDMDGHAFRFVIGMDPGMLKKSTRGFPIEKSP